MNIAVERVFENNEIITWMFGLVFFLLTCVQLLFPVRLKSLLTLFFSKYYFLDFQTALQDTFSLFNVLLFLIQNLILSIFLFKACIFLDVAFQNEMLFFFQLFFGLDCIFCFNMS